MEAVDIHAIEADRAVAIGARSAVVLLEPVYEL